MRFLLDRGIEIGVANYCEKRVLPYNRQKLFDIVADVERYPEFLPGWIKAQILSGGKDHALVQQTLGLGPVRTGFRSRTEYLPPETIHIRTNDGPFEHLEITWHFKPVSEHSSEVTLAVTVRLRQMMFREYLESWFSTSTSSILTAFERRAGQLAANSSQPQR